METSKNNTFRWYRKRPLAQNGLITRTILPTENNQVNWDILDEPRSLYETIILFLQRLPTWTSVSVASSPTGRTSSTRFSNYHSLEFVSRNKRF